MKKIRLSKFKIIISLGIIALLSFGFLEGDGGSRFNKGNAYNQTQNSGKVGDAYRLNINNIDLPFNTSGTIADVTIPPNDAQGRFGGTNFLFSSGFFISGYTNGTLWACAQATASRISNFIPGRSIPQSGDDAQMYVLLREDPPFGDAWQDWIDAVKLGADFYDGDGDGVYSPVDKNGNGEWDPDEDAPDLLGDATAWCLFNDGILAAQRIRFEGIDPQGIEIRQTVFAFASAGALGNLVFIRYRLSNSGMVAESLDSVYFSVWADPDLGDFNDDLVGVDTLRNSGFTYNDGPDDVYGSNPPCFMIDFFSGPQSYIPGETFMDTDGDKKYTDGVDIPLDTAFIKRGLLLGVEVLPGAKNLPISSFVHYQQSDPILGDPDTEDEARAYMLGKNKVGDILDPCTFNLGDVIGVDCSAVNPLFWYSGDPVIPIGWINNRPTDQRQMTNTGPINLVVGEPDVDIIVAYVVGQGVDALSSITVARSIDDGAQFIFDKNFVAPSSAPVIQVVAESGTEFIDFLFPTWEQVSVENTTEAWDLRYQLFNIYTYQSNSEQILIDGNINRKLYTSFSLDNFIFDVYEENSETGGVELRYPRGETLMDPVVYADPATGRIRVRVTHDPWTNQLLIKGVPYYFAFTSVLLNYDALFPKDPDDSFGDPGDYVLSSSGFVGAVENVAKIYNLYPGDPDGGVKLGEDAYDPPVLVQPANHLPGGASLGNVGYDVVYKDQLTSSQYEVSFFNDSSSSQYQMFWSLTNLSTNTVNPDSSLSYTYGQTAIDEEIIDGFIPRVEDQIPAFGEATYTPVEDTWYKTFSTNDGTGVYYVGNDIPQSSTVITFPGGLSDVTSADRLRSVELRFGESGKAYRYINDYIGGFITRTNYTYASAITAADTVGKGVIGNWDDVNDRPFGFVDVPFTAWMVDEQYFDIDNVSEPYQLAVGFVERKNSTTFPNGNPDGVWDPSDSLLASGEIIIIFDADYDPTGSQIEYTGGDFTTPSGTETVWSDLLKATANPPKVPDDAQGISEEQKAIFESPWFNTLYVASFQKTDPNSFYSDGDVFQIPMDVYPYTEEDVYQFVITGSTITDAEEQELWNKVNVFPNPLYGFNTGTSYAPGGVPDEPFVTFSNLPTEITIRIYSLSGLLLRTLTQEDKSEPSSPLLRWDLQNESQLRVASGMYLAIVSSPKYGDKVMKFAIIMPQKQLPKF